MGLTLGWGVGVDGEKSGGGSEDQNVAFLGVSALVWRSDGSTKAMVCAGHTLISRVAAMPRPLLGMAVGYTPETVIFCVSVAHWMSFA